MINFLVFFMLSLVMLFWLVPQVEVVFFGSVVNLVIICCSASSRYVSAVLPMGSEELRGDEAQAIIKFKNALGIDDPDAASMHIEVLVLGLLISCNTLWTRIRFLNF